MSAIKNIFNVVGVIPVIGSAVGSARIGIALNKAYTRSYENRANQHMFKGFFSSINKETAKDIYHGSCEIVPIIGPTIYWISIGVSKIAAKIINVARHTTAELDEVAPKKIEAKGEELFNKLQENEGKLVEITVAVWNGKEEDLSEKIITGTLVATTNHNLGDWDGMGGYNDFKEKYNKEPSFQSKYGYGLIEITIKNPDSKEESCHYLFQRKNANAIRAVLPSLEP